MFKVFLSLLKTDLYLFSKTIKDKLVNSIIWVLPNLVIPAYLLSTFGMQESFAVFQATSLFISVIGFEIYAKIFEFVADLEGAKYINYELSLPLSAKGLILQKVFMQMINSMILVIAAAVTTKLVLWNKFCLMQICWWQFLLTILVTTFFFGMFSLFLSTLIPNMAAIDNVLMRILFPIWIFGCFQYSLQGAWGISPVIAIVSLISPYTYATEAIRAACLGQTGYLPFWLSISVLILASVGCFYVAYARLKRKLDFAY